MCSSDLSAADSEKPAHHFLSRADLGKGAVPTGIKINPERLGMSIEDFVFHGVRTLDVLTRIFMLPSKNAPARQLLFQDSWVAQPFPQGA